jgi:uncharacterized membrane protein YhaH (DUF805 family)
MSHILDVYFSPKGRLRRLPYFLYGLVIGLVAGVLGVVAQYLSVQLQINMQQPDYLAVMFLVGILIFFIIFIYASWILGMKRFHDLDHSGWWMLLSLVPIVGFLVALYLLFFRGTEGPNRFGNSPDS